VFSRRKAEKVRSLSGEYQKQFRFIKVEFELIFYIMENRKVKNILILILFLLLVGGCYLLFGNFSKGARAGTMIKFSQRGILIKTYEGELNLGMILNSDNAQQTSVANIWNFSVHAGDEAVINTLEEALLSGKRVKVKYHEKFVRIFLRGDTKYFVYEAEIIK
jgi:hypothetical protein